MSMFGLLQRDIEYILQAMQSQPQIVECIIFGSRAMGNYKEGSDVDLAIKGDRIDRRIILQLSDRLNETYPLPYFFDIIQYDEISNKKLKLHIDTFGKILYQKPPQT